MTDSILHCVLLFNQDFCHDFFVVQVRYGISLKDHDKFLIDTVVVEGKHVFMPFGEKGGKAVTFVK